MAPLDIQKCLDWYPVNPGMSSREVAKNLLDRLQQVILADVPGDVVELGCHAGDTSVFLSRMIQELDPTRTLHLYDSFEGLPAKHANDNPLYGDPGTVKTTRDMVVRRFLAERLPMPRIHAGWFSELWDKDLPERIAFAFFDGDLYQSIMDSWRLVYPRLSPGAVVCVHDYDVSNWPGTKLACDEFFSDKPEKAAGVCFLLGAVTKQ